MFRNGFVRVSEKTSRPNTEFSRYVSCEGLQDVSRPQNSGIKNGRNASLRASNKSPLSIFRRVNY